MFDEKTLAERDGDAAILAAFQEWREARQQYCDADDRAAENRADDRICMTQNRLADLPASGVMGLSLKAFVLAHLIMERADFETTPFDWSEANEADPAALGRFTPEHYDSRGVLTWAERALRGLVTDAARFIPELAPLAAGIIDAPVTLPEPREDEQKAALRRRCKALAAEYPVDDLPDGDAGLIEAERRLREIQAREKVLYDEFKVSMEVEEKIINPILDPPENKLIDFIQETKPETMIGIALKMRHITFDGCDWETVIEQCLPIVECHAEREAR